MNAPHGPTWSQTDSKRLAQSILQNVEKILQGKHLQAELALAG